LTILLCDCLGHTSLDCLAAIAPKRVSPQFVGQENSTDHAPINGNGRSGGVDAASAYPRGAGSFHRRGVSCAKLGILIKGGGPLEALARNSATDGVAGAGISPHCGRRDRCCGCDQGLTLVTPGKVRETMGDFEPEDLDSLCSRIHGHGRSSSARCALNLVPGCENVEFSAEP
jgi:hypothetical protein